jgi:prepilin-type N-terminal cleavage/methylation domain-containing protein
MKAGFTLVELLIVMAIVAVMSSFAILSFSGSKTAARDAQRQSDVHQYQNAVEVYANANNGVFPVKASAVNPSTLCGASNPLGNIVCPNDPLGTNAYQYVTDASGTKYVIWATLEKPVPAQVFYVCSTGYAGTKAATGFTGGNGNCP